MRRTAGRPDSRHARRARRLRLRPAPLSSGGEQGSDPVRLRWLVSIPFGEAGPSHLRPPAAPGFSGGQAGVPAMSRVFPSLPMVRAHAAERTEPSGQGSDRGDHGPLAWWGKEGPGG
jgi:hypothetical protein